jgi:hypothetical protein
METNLDRAMLRRHLALAEKHVASGAIHLEQQRQTVAKLEQGGYRSAAIARDVLREFDAIQQWHIEHRNTILFELARASRLPRPKRPA